MDFKKWANGWLNPKKNYDLYKGQHVDQYNINFEQVANSMQNAQISSQQLQNALKKFQNVTINASGVFHGNGTVPLGYGNTIYPLKPASDLVVTSNISSHLPNGALKSRVLAIAEAVLPQDIDVWLAGGSIRRVYEDAVEEADYDLFFSNIEDLFKCWAYIEKIAVKIENIYRSSNSYSFDLHLPEPNSIPIKIQLIKHFHEDVSRLFASFDYTICQFAIDQHKYLYYTGEAIKDVEDRVLKVQSIKYAITSMQRMIKFHDEGYKIPKATMRELLSAKNRENEEAYY